MNPIQSELQKQIFFNPIKYRLIGIFGVLFYVPWGLLCIYVFNAKEDILVRSIIGLAPLFLLAYSFAKKIDHRWAEAAIGAFLIFGELQMIHLAFLNDFHMVYIIGAFTVYTTVGSFCAHRVYYIAGCILSLLFMPLLANHFDVELKKWLPLFFQLVTVYTVLIGNFLHKMSLQGSLIQKSEQLQDSQKRQAESAKMASLGQLAGGIAHEINNPMAIVLGKNAQIATMTEKDNIDKNKIIEATNKIKMTVERVGRITKGLLTFARDGEADPFLECNIAATIINTCEIVGEKLAGMGIDLRLKFAEKVLVQCRETQISQVVFNLLSNSMDAVESLHEKWIQIEIQESSDNIQILFTDSGQGISSGIAEKILDPFFTTKELGKGTGLGLSIAKGIIHAHKGHLHLNSACQNTQFIIDLPKKNGSQSLPQDLAVPSAA